MHRCWINTCFIVVAALSLGQSQVFAQSRDRDGERDRDRSERSRFDPKEMLARMDVNKNGLIDPEEVSSRSRGFLERPAQAAGLDISKPMRIDKLIKGFEAPRDKDPKDKEKDDRSRESSNKSSQPLVPGFGTGEKPTKVAGFDPPSGKSEDRDKRSSGSSSGSSSKSTSSGSSSTKSSSSSDAASEAEKVKKYAESLIKQYDENKNGVLDKEEWTKLKAADGADANNDKIVTLDELTIKLGGYGKSDSPTTVSTGGSSNSSSSGGSGSSSKPSGSSRPSEIAGRTPSGKPGEKKSYRSTPPTERLPKGLPDWFLRNDENADGQIQMSEYVSLWSSAKADEFVSFDLDGDGYITAKECLAKAEKKK